MKIDWDNIRVVKNIEELETPKVIPSDEVVKPRHFGVSEYRKSIKELKSELKRRGLKYSGNKEELLHRIKNDDNRLEVLTTEHQLRTLAGLKKRVTMFEDYEEAAQMQWEAARTPWEEAVARKYKVQEEKAQAIAAYEGFKTNLKIQGIDTQDF